MVANLIIILDQVSITEDTPMPFLCEEDIMSKLKEVSAANITVSETNDDLMQPTYKDQRPLAIIYDEPNEKRIWYIGLYLSSTE